MKDPYNSNTNLLNSFNANTNRISEKFYPVYQYADRTSGIQIGYTNLVISDN